MARKFYPVKVGIELTFVSKKARRWTAQVPQQKYYDVSKPLREKYPNTRGGCALYHRACLDGHCLEISTKPLRSPAAVTKVYSGITQEAKNHDLVPFNHRCPGGGGHLHLDKPKNDELCRRLIADFVNRPYLQWVFGSWYDNRTAASLLSDYTYAIVNGPARTQASTSRGRYDGWGRFLDGAMPATQVDLGHKCKGMRFTPYGDHGTVEFRFFAAAFDLEEQLDHIEFAMRYYQYVLAAPQMPTTMTFEKMQAYTFEQASDEFRELIEELGLDWARYKRFVDYNLFHRFEACKKYGNTYLLA